MPAPTCERCGEPIADGAAFITYGPPINGVAHEPACLTREETIARAARLGASLRPVDPMLARIRELEATVATLRELREFDAAALAAARSERDEAKAAFLRCAEAIGVVYEADGHASAPGPIDVVERYIREAVRNADAHIEMVERVAVAAGRVGVADADDVREGLAWEAIETLANRAAELSTIRAALAPLVERVRETRLRERRLVAQMCDADYDQADPADFAALAKAHAEADSDVDDAEHEAMSAIVEMFPAAKE